MPLERLRLVLLMSGLIIQVGCSDQGYRIEQQQLPIAVGETTVELVIYTAETPGMNYVVLHDNEDTSAEAVLDIMKRHGGRLVEVRHSGNRNVSFQLGDSVFTFDPNRIFTEQGIRASLDTLGIVSEEAVAEVSQFALRLIQEMQVVSGNLTIAAHNNTEGEYSIYSYTSEGDEASNARFVHLTNQANADDFFFVTHPAFYTELRQADFNVVLQDNINVKDDGSLSVYCAKNDIPYINVEAQHGHFEEQVQMLEYLNSRDMHSLLLEPADP